MADRYRRKPTEIEAVQWDGTYSAISAMRAMGAKVVVLEVPAPRPLINVLAGVGGVQGHVPVPLGHWVARAADDDYYPIDGDVFAATYEKVTDG